MEAVRTAGPSKRRFVIQPNLTRQGAGSYAEDERSVRPAGRSRGEPLRHRSNCRPMLRRWRASRRNRVPLARARPLRRPASQDRMWRRLAHWIASLTAARRTLGEDRGIMSCGRNWRRLASSGTRAESNSYTIVEGKEYLPRENVSHGVRLVASGCSHRKLSG
jgi:hypothetical protein